MKRGRYISELMHKKLIIFLKEMEVPYYLLSAKVLKKSPQTLSLKLKTDTVKQEEFQNLLDHFKVKVEDIENIKIEE